MDSQVLRDKIAFFEELDALNEPIDEEDDRLSKEESDFRAKIGAIFSLQGKSNRAPSRAPQSFPPKERTFKSNQFPTPKRSFSAPTSMPGTSQTPIVIQATPEPRAPGGPKPATGYHQPPSSSTSIVQETPVLGLVQASHPLLQRSATLPLTRSSAHTVAEQSPSMASSMRKRKRQGPAVEAVPESDQILGDIAFYYIPNDDVAPARKLRIRKAQSYGARWVRELSSASHAIVDNHLSYKDIDKIVAPASGLTITNEDYPIDCIAHRALLNPDQPRYRVSGFPAAKDKSPPVSSPVHPESSKPSLQPKNPNAELGRRDTAPRSSTPPRSGESSARDDVVEVSQTQRSTDHPESDSDCLVGAKPPPRSQTSSPRVEDSMTRPASQPRLVSNIQDELTEYIQLMLQYKGLPLDTDEDDDAQSVRSTEVVSTSEVDSGSEDERARKKWPAKRSGKDIPFEDRFACNRGGKLKKSGDDSNPNARTIEVLQSMCDYYTRTGDQWRTLAYRKGINTLSQQTTKITTEQEAYSLPNIGPRLAAKIEEIVTTDTLQRLENTRDEPLDRALSTFLGIYGVGTTVAKRWATQGFRTLDDLIANADLTTNQRIGIDHYDDLNSRIPRAEVTALGAYVSREAKKIDPAVELLIGGSYRRGSSSSGDIDFIVTKKGTTSVSGDLVTFLEELIRVLTAKGFLVATLAALHSTRRPSKDGPGSKWHGCCVLPQSRCTQLGITREKPIWRRIDFLLVPESEYGAALIYFTGNDIFNRSMRLLASKKRMRLNQRGLYKEVLRGKGRVKLTEGELIEGRDERRIFEILGVKWREPEERWC
jgi:DNA polymerase IV